MRFPSIGIAARLTLLTIALVLIGQLINAAILGQVQRSLRVQRTEAIVSERIAQASRLSELSPLAARRLVRRPGFSIGDAPPQEGLVVPKAEAQLGEILRENGMAERGYSVRILSRNRRQLIVASVELSDGRWLIHRQVLPANDEVPWAAIGIQTAVLSLLLIVPAVLVGRRVGRTLRMLTASADGFLTGKPAPPLPEGGPPDVAALCRAFAELEQRALAALEERSAMLGAVGHDLRTPLASLRIRVEEIDDAELRQKMIDSIETLARALDDVLVFSKGTSQGTFEDVRSDALLRRLVSSYTADEVTLGRADAVTLHCAPESVLRALRNLADNAIRYGGRAEVSVRLQDDEAVFAVEDDGPGIPEGDLERLQRPFTRADEARSGGSGVGLGLAIARGVAEAHQGRLVLENRPNGGLRAALILSRKDRI